MTDQISTGRPDSRPWVRLFCEPRHARSGPPRTLQTRPNRRVAPALEGSHQRGDQARAHLGYRPPPPQNVKTYLRSAHTPLTMSFTSNDNLVLVAPRPVRLASGAAPFPFHSPVAHRPRSRAAILSAATDAFDRLMLADDSGDQHEHRAPELSEKDRLSPRTSPRYVSRSALR